MASPARPEFAYAERVRAELRRILASPQFAKAGQASGFLTFVVNAELEGRGPDLKEVAIGIDFYGVSDFDPKADTRVRVRANDVRNRLAEFYQANPAPGLRIELPTGGYRPAFSEVTAPVIVPSVQPETRAEPTPFPWRWIGLAASFALVAVAAYFLYTALRPQERRVAILAPRVLGEDASLKALGEGIAAATSGRLGEIERFQRNLWFLPAPDVSQLKVGTVAEARSRLSANYVVAGTLERVGDRLRLTLHLYNARERQEASRVLDFTAADSFSVQDRAVNEIAEMLDLLITPEVRKVIADSGPKGEAGIFYLQGLGYLERDDVGLESAIELFERAAKLEPENAQILAALADARLRRYRFERDSRDLAAGREAATRALALDASLPDVWVVSAALHRADSRKDAALADLRRALSLNPSHANALSELANLQVAMNRLPEAEESYRRAIAAKPGYWRFHRDAGGYYLNHGRLELARSHLSKALELAPDNTLVLTNLSVLELRQERVKPAIALLQRAVAIRPSAAAYNTLGDLAMNDGNWRLAIEALSKAVQLSPAAPLPRLNLAQAYRLSGDVGNARENYMQALQSADRRIETSPDYVPIRALRAVALAGLGRKDEAIEQAVAATNALPGNILVAQAALKVFELTRERDRSLELIRKMKNPGALAADLRSDPDLKGLLSDPAYRRLTLTQ
ncbi:MAG: tetratricopeptide repeat protein [Bryobacteraceae bacterium]|nr:tetratricopeptide repeat protein [Bryobacteraceae bacterium]